MAELVLRGVAFHGTVEGRALRAARIAAVALGHTVRAVARVARFLIRLASPSMQVCVSGRGWRGLPGSPSPGAWLGTSSGSEKGLRQFPTQR
jgi:hypothetical protein